MTWFNLRSLFERILLVTVAVLAVVIVVSVARHTWRGSQTAKVDARVSAGHIDAVTKSGADAVATQGNRQAAEAADAEIEKGARNEIDHATNTSGVVNAGRNGLRELRRTK
jgi:hypothetical protein